MSPLSDPLAALLGLVILSGEGLVTALGLFHPRVDAAYRTYFIEDQRSCYVPPPLTAAFQAGLRQDDITVARLDADSQCYLLRKGWYPVENWGVWSDGKTASIELPVPPGRRHLSLSLTSFALNNQQSVSISINRQSAGTFFLAANRPTMIRLTVPANAGNSLVIAFHAREAAAPSDYMPTDDTRELGIGLTALAWH
jgi:hypothetical protein